jgi:hypothetical protein
MKRLAEVFEGGVLVISTEGYYSEVVVGFVTRLIAFDNGLKATLGLIQLSFGEQPLPLL